MSALLWNAWLGLDVKISLYVLYCPLCTGLGLKGPGSVAHPSNEAMDGQRAAIVCRHQSQSECGRVSGSYAIEFPQIRAIRLLVRRTSASSRWPRLVAAISVVVCKKPTCPIQTGPDEDPAMSKKTNIDKNLKESQNTPYTRSQQDCRNIVAIKKCSTGIT